MYVTINYNMDHTICICDTARSKLIPFMYVHSRILVHV